MRKIPKKLSLPINVLDATEYSYYENVTIYVEVTIRDHITIARLIL